MKRKYNPDHDLYYNVLEDIRQAGICNMFGSTPYLVFEDYFSKNDEISGYVGRTVSVKDGIKNFIKDYDLLDILVECYEDSLKEVFEQEALDSYD